MYKLEYGNGAEVLCENREPLETMVKELKDDTIIIIEEPMSTLDYLNMRLRENIDD